MSDRRFVVLACIAGCGLDVTGGAAADAGSNAPEASALPVCRPLVIDDSLTQIADMRWLRRTNSDGFPQAVVDAPDSGPMVALIPPMQKDKAGGLWLNTPVPLKAFDVKFEYLVDCPKTAWCADGIGVAWLDTLDTATLETTALGATLGLPKQRGNTVTVTLLKHLYQAEQKQPVTLAIRTMVPDPPGASIDTRVGDDYVKGLRAMTIRVRGDQVTVTNGAETLTAQVPPFTKGLFGFVAATGSDVEGAYIRSFHGEFYGCDPSGRSDAGAP